MSCSNFNSCRRGVNPQLVLPLRQAQCIGSLCDGSVPNGYYGVKLGYPAFPDCGQGCSENFGPRYTINKPVTWGGNYGVAPINDQINFGNRTSGNIEVGNGGRSCSGCIGSSDLTFSGCFRSYL